jgi:uncharacterized protein YndB with AHSA1/START domain
MTPIVSTVEIARPPEEVFAYATDPSRFSEWQKGVVSGGVEGGHEQAVGSRCTTTRKLGGGERTTTQEVTEITPPTRWVVRGVDGPIRADVTVSVDPLADGASSRVTIALDFHGHGIGRVLVPLFVRRDAEKEVPISCRKLKQLLENGA